MKKQYLKKVGHFSMMGLLFNAIILIPGYGQEIKIAVLNGFFKQQERLINPSIYSGYKFGIRTQYLKETVNSNLLFANVDLSGSISSWNTANNELFHTKGEFELGYLPKINGMLHSGPSVRSTYQYDKYSLNYGYPFGFAAHSINWSSLVHHNFNKDWQINFLVSIPIIGLFSRPDKVVLREFKQEYRRPYFNKNMYTGSFNIHRAVTAKLDISRRINDKLSFNMGYYADWLSHSRPSPLRSVSHLLSTGIQINK